MNDGDVVVVSGQSKALLRYRREAARITLEAPEVPLRLPTLASEADWVVLGPGSGTCVIIPHLLVPDINRALATTDAHRALVFFNLARQRGETDPCRPPITRVLREYAPMLKLDVVLTPRHAMISMTRSSPPRSWRARSPAPGPVRGRRGTTTCCVPCRS